MVTGLLVTMAQGTVPEQQENLMEMISVELEASMQSSVLSELQAASSSVGEGPPTALPDCSAKNGGGHSGIPDSSAIVGQVFQLKVPQGFANATCNVHVSASKKVNVLFFSHLSKRCFVSRHSLKSILFDKNSNNNHSNKLQFKTADF